MTKSVPSPHTVLKPKRIYYALGATLLLLIGVNLFVISVVFTQSLYSSFIIDVPGRGGGNTYSVTSSEFNTIFIVSVVVAVLVAMAVLILMSGKRQSTAAWVLACLTSFVGVYGMVLLGNGFDVLWSGWWSVVGVLLSAALFISILVLIFSSFKKVKPFNSKAL